MWTLWYCIFYIFKHLCSAENPFSFYLHNPSDYLGIRRSPVGSPHRMPGMWNTFSVHVVTSLWNIRQWFTSFNQCWYDDVDLTQYWPNIGLLPNGPSHYLNQRQLLINEVMWNSSQSSSLTTIPSNDFETQTFEITATSPRARWVEIKDLQWFEHDSHINLQNEWKWLEKDDRVPY